MKNCTLTCALILLSLFSLSQSCPTASLGTVSISANPNTYYPGTQATVNVGATSIVLGASGFGTAAINAGDVVLIIQMQGADFNSSNNNSYGDGVSGGNGNGYLNNSDHLAGNMEYAVAANNVPLAGGTLNLTSGTVRSYRNVNYSGGGTGQYRYQVIRVPVYYNATLTASITAPNWNGNTGGVLVIHAVNNFSFNAFGLSAAGMGFRGGGSRQLGGDGGASGDYRTSANNDNNGSKGEGSAGSPRYMNNNGSLLNTGNQGYPSGSHGRGAPGNAGGGGTDGNPGSNDENSGGGGGGNGGAGGRGGNSWNSNQSVGGEPAATFAQRAANRVVMGGGGGSGTTNNGTGTPGSGFASSGAAGGGIVILNSKFVTTAGTINVNGSNANNTVDNDGSGGGGAGGSVLIRTTSGHGNITVSANGGNGGTNSGGGVAHGPGGGGGGGVIFSNNTLNGASTVTAGLAGITAGGGNFGAADGTNGVMVQNSVSADFPVLSNACVLLPVTLIRFKAVGQSGNTIVSWMTELEINLQAFELERSVDGLNFNRIAVIGSRGGNQRNEYSYTDINAANQGKLIYYRLKMLDLDRQFKYSTIEPVNFDNGIVLNIQPTLLRQGEKLVFTSAGIQGSLWMQVFTSTGVLVRSLSLPAGRMEIPTDHWSKGFYILKVTTSGIRRTFRLVIQ